jgi:hypothetical protein
VIPPIVYSPSLNRVFVLGADPEGQPQWLPVWDTHSDRPAGPGTLTPGHMPEDAQQVDGWRPMWTMNPLGPGASGWAWRCVCGVLNGGRWSSESVCNGCRHEATASAVAGQYRTVRLDDYDEAGRIIGRFKRAVSTLGGILP